MKEAISQGITIEINTEQVDEAIEKAAKAVDIMISQGADAAMNEYNRKVPVQK